MIRSIEIKGVNTMDKETLLSDYLNYLQHWFDVFLKKVVPKTLPSDWWNNPEMRSMYPAGEYEQRMDEARTKYDNLSNYKIDAYINVLLCSWYSLGKLYGTNDSKEFNYENDKYEYEYFDVFNTENRNLVLEISDIRNTWGHENINLLPSGKFEEYKRKMKSFAEFISTDKDVNEIFLSEDKKLAKIIGIIERNVIDPAIKREGLSQDIKNSVEDTKRRLRKKATAKEVYDFFKDALDAKRGLELEAEFNKFPEQKKFTDIEPLVDKWYKDHYP
jgi:hypothetical protein